MIIFKLVICSVCPVIKIYLFKIPLIYYNYTIRMMTYISENQKGDHLIHPPDKKNNPWMEKVKTKMQATTKTIKYFLLSSFL